MEQTELESRAVAHLAQTNALAKSHKTNPGDLLAEYHEDFVARAERFAGTSREQETADELAVSTRAVELHREASA